MARALAASIQVRRSLARQPARVTRPPYCHRNATVRVLVEPRSRPPAGLTRSVALQPEQSSARARAIPFAARPERNARTPRRSPIARRIRRAASIRHRPHLALQDNVALLVYAFVREPPAPAVAATVTPAGPTQLKPTPSVEPRGLRAEAVLAARPVKLDSVDVPRERPHAETRASTCRISAASTPIAHKPEPTPVCGRCARTTFARSSRRLVAARREARAK
jgi:hypothetical protein